MDWRLYITKKEMNLNAIKLIVFDLDGTLYHQNLLRFFNFLILFVCLLRRQITVLELKILLSFRRAQEISAQNEQKITLIFEAIAEEFNQSPSDIKRIRNQWMIDNQRRTLVLSQRRWLTRLIFRLREQGYRVAIWSDNPIEKKLEFLECSVDYCLSNEEKSVGFGKPNPKGLLEIMSFFQVSKTDVILVGDRGDRDGLAANRAGVRFIKIGFASRVILKRLLLNSKKGQS